MKRAGLLAVFFAASLSPQAASPQPFQPSTTPPPDFAKTVIKTTDLGNRTYMLEGEGGYPLEAWHSEFQRIRDDLRDAVTTEGRLTARPPEQQKYLSDLLIQFWTSSDEVFSIAGTGDTRLQR